MAENTEEVVKDDEIEEADTEVDKKTDDKEDEVVPVRKSVINAQRRIIESQAKKLEKTSKDEEDSDEELTPKARKLIEQEVDRRVAPLQDELAFRDYFASHPEDRKFEAQARKRFDAWGTVPVEEVMKTLRPTVNVEEREKAIEKVQRNSLKGSTVRKGEEQVATTEADYKDIYQKVKRGETGAALKKLGL